MSQITIWPMRIACWIPKATITHLECIICIVFPLQHWLDERASMLRYRYRTYHVLFLNDFFLILFLYYRPTSSTVFQILNFSLMSEFSVV
jgi:hypothetical protein